MLRTRVLTGAVIAVAAIVIVFFLPPAGFRMAIALLLLIGCHEYTRLGSLNRPVRALVLGAQTAIFGWLLIAWEGVQPHAAAFLVAACLSWCLMLLRLVTFRPQRPPGLNYRFLTAFAALASLSFAAYALFWLHDRPAGGLLVLLLLLIIWSADIGAYFTGRRFGRHRLAPAISPGKTWEGLAGGLILATIVAAAYSAMTSAIPSPALLVAPVAVLTAAVSAAGDLFISIHKRTVDLKDSGRLFPGHGGVLDRFDSLLAGAPFFALGVYLLRAAT
ncbi:phosphatidate cytidylyltransferase [Elongatibacter sediminis]|uniref:Phosphatidate cytidylyltransferase n=1 Tax=Elongatibacter sediminis TaxID=3119006 RepID=A0AAW9RHS4_9GAMM